MRMRIQGCCAPFSPAALNRCATYQGEGGKWNKFGGRLAWDNTAICNNNPAWSGRGAHKTGDDYPAAPNIDHTQVRPLLRVLLAWGRHYCQADA
jgi:alpha-amylase